MKPRGLVLAAAGMLLLPSSAMVFRPPCSTGGLLRAATPPSPVMMAKRSSRREARRAAKAGEEPGAAAAPEAAAAPAPAAEGPIMGAQEQNLVSSFVQDKKGVALPSFDDFRRRDETEDGRDTAVPPELARAPRLSPEEQKRQTAQEKLFELLTFDTIDDRVERSDEAAYDNTARILGRGTASQGGAYILPYLQSGHMLLLVVLLLASSISYPGFPLTQVPDEYRALLQEGLVITYAVNAATAVYSRGIASAKQEPVGFWFGKIFLLGGLAFGELRQIEKNPEKRFPNQK